MPMLGESEKSRLQRIFEWSNRGIGIQEPNRWRDDDQENNEEVQLIRKQMQGSVKKQKRWLDILANEVVERETVLKVMRNEGEKQLSKEKLKVAIQERMKRMKELQNIIARQERQDKQNKMEALLVDPTKCCQATYNAEKERNKTKGRTQDGYSSNSKQLLEHNLNTTDKPLTNHRRYKHSISPSTLSIILPHRLGSTTHRLGSTIARVTTQTKENHHHHKENHHNREIHHHHVDKQQHGSLKTSKHHITRCLSKNGLKIKLART